MPSESVYLSKAKARWGKKAIWIHGEGRYATLAFCGQQLSVELHDTLDEAEGAKRRIDAHGCGGMCRGGKGKHFLVDLDEEIRRDENGHEIL